MHHDRALLWTRVLYKARIGRLIRLVVKLPGATGVVRVPLSDVLPPWTLIEREPWMVTVLHAVAKLSAGAFVDVGTNAGQTLIRFLQSPMRGPYIGFEPNPIAAASAMRIAAANRGARDLTIISAALGEKVAITPLRTSTISDESASIVEGFRDSSHYADAFPVVVLHGDSALTDLHVGRIGLIKVDVEGAELEVLKGLASTLRTHRPIVSCEILPVYDIDSPIGRFRRARTDSVLALLKDLQYAVVRIRTNAIALVETIESHDDLELSNYLFIPRDDLAPTLACIREQAETVANTRGYWT